MKHLKLNRENHMNKYISNKVCDFFIGIGIFFLLTTIICIMIAGVCPKLDKLDSFKYKIMVGIGRNEVSYYSNEFNTNNNSFYDVFDTNHLVTLDRVNYYIIQQHP